MEFFAAGKFAAERLFLAGNRVGKTLTGGGYEVALHVMGCYPDWWPGYRFKRQTNWWVAGKKGEQVRDIMQEALLGPFDNIGTGLIEGDRIGKITRKQGIADAVDKVWIRHENGRNSTIGFKSYAEGRSGFEGTKKDGIWNDEEPPMDVYSEELLRLTATRPGQLPGMMINTFTPLEGMSEVVLYYLPGGKLEGEQDDGLIQQTA